ncbi:MAG: tripartite tricarboxylate transporter substrate binding protein [Nitrospinaceae bacterium]|nr:tripartite tricarboxylate transporter substrate binding protein [Nitrospinaceae bacterium]
MFLMGITQSHAAKKFPWKPIRVIVALGAGGGNDLNTRAVASVAHTYLGQPMIVQLMPGGGGKIGMNALMRAKNDGHTLMMSSTNHLTVSPHVRNMGFDPLKDFEFVFLFTKGDYMMTAMASQPWKGFKQFVGHAKKNPGKLSYGSSGVYGMGHLMLLKVMADAGIKLKHIPFKGGGPAYRAGLGGHIDTFGALPATGGTLGRYRRGQIQILGVASKKRNKLFPKVPTFRESGVNFVLASKRIMIAPKGTPKEHVDILVSGFKKLVKDKTYKSLLKKMGDKPTPLWGDALKKDVADDYMAYGEIFKSIGLEKKK